MYPVICKIGPFQVYSYGLMLVLAFIAATSLVLAEAKRQKLDHEAIFNFLFTALVCGIIGSRLFYVLEHLGYYVKNPLEIIMLQQGGLSWFGGLMLGSSAGIWYLKKKKLPIYRTLDLIVPYLALAQSIGRIGCLLNGCCYGRTPFLPTQMYASLALLAIYIILRMMQASPKPQGTIFFSYLLLYSIKRFTIEFWREDNPAVFYGLSLFQLLSIVLFVLAAAKLCLIKKK
ncbi:MAG: prolipoprotein diacylglyceryl transferase [Candidatus Omnitrophota bacterium]